MLSVLATGCGPDSVAADASTSLYALVDGIDGVFFYPPLGPEPTPAAAFDATLLDGLTVTVEVENDDGTATILGAFTQNTQPAVALLAERERYWVNIPAATYLTDRSRTYRVAASLDGNEIGRSVLSSRIFDVMAYRPDLPLGVHLRVEGTGAVRAARRQRLSGRPSHCSDGRQNKDETGVDCGGSQCGPCRCNTTSGTAASVSGCGWYLAGQAAQRDACISNVMRMIGTGHLITIVLSPHPCTTNPSQCSPPSYWGGPYFDLWTAYWCPAALPNAVAQASGGWRCYSSCPPGTTLVAGQCLCN